jgi:hypothetical protein
MSWFFGGKRSNLSINMAQIRNPAGWTRFIERDPDISMRGEMTAIATVARLLAIPGMVLASAVTDAAELASGNGPTGGPYFCADVASGSASAGTSVQVWYCHGGLNQQFSMLPGQTFTYSQNTATPNALEIRAMGGAMCLDASGTTPGTKVEINNCDNAGFEAWIYTDTGQILNANSALCLDATNQQLGTQLVTNGCTSPPSPSQIWRIDNN